MSKSELLETLAGKNRGLLATEVEKKAILVNVSRLEDRNPNPRPLERLDLLEGNWRLIYTSSNSLLNLGRFPILQLGQIYQCVRTANTKIYNIAEIAGVPYLEAIVSVEAGFAPVNERRVDVKFERAISGLQRLIGYQSPSDFIQKIATGKKFTGLDFKIKTGEQQGWLDITYLDQDMRVGRGNEGSVFVLTKN